MMRNDGALPVSLARPASSARMEDNRAEKGKRAHRRFFFDVAFIFERPRSTLAP
jgi:hypothetical protein